MERIFVLSSRNAESKEMNPRERSLNTTVYARVKIHTLGLYADKQHARKKQMKGFRSMGGRTQIPYKLLKMNDIGMICKHARTTENVAKCTFCSYFPVRNTRQAQDKMHSLKLLYILLEYSFFHLNQVKSAIRINTRVQVLGLLA